jgi:hypothetical protein
MVELLAGNVLLKPAQKRRILSHLRRSSQLGELIGDSRLAVSLRRTGRTVEARAHVHNKKGTFECKARDASWESAFLRLVRSVHAKVHAQRLRPIAA